jgi:osmotically-inducible protein OsmY
MGARGRPGGDEVAEMSGGTRRGRDLCRRLVTVLGLVVAIGACATFDPWQDTRIESEVKARLVAQKDANLTRLGVVTREATVYLSGTVVSLDQKALAESVAKDVTGVKTVVNTLEVHPGAE